MKEWLKTFFFLLFLGTDLLFFLLDFFFLVMNYIRIVKIVLVARVNIKKMICLLIIICKLFIGNEK